MCSKSVVLDITPSGDVTAWLYDIASGAMTNKVYADGKGPSYTYTPDGKLSQRTWARGIVTDYSYDAWGNLTNTVYSDDTPTISLTYDTLGRQISAHDAAGVTTFLYDSFGSITNETVVGVAGTNTIIRHWDSFGRSLGYSLVGRDDPIAPQRQSTLAYDPTTGRLSSMQVPDSNTQTPQTLKHFTWSYLPGSDLKSSLSYPNGLFASWTYDANNQLLQVCNAFPTNIISQYDYTYDAAGRRVACGKSGSAFAQNDTLSYGYNEKSELTNAVASVDSDYRYSYAFDDIGNRESSSERGTNSVYTANSLNQYTEISSSALSASPRETFTPQFDDDGNQTLIKTATGIWSVTYNGENRPVFWTCTQSNNQTITNNQTILMSFDRMGRRVTKNAQRFVYDGYLQIANFELSTSNFELQTFIWDPTEPIATRPLAWNFSTFQPFNFSTSYYTHDGNKNVSEVVADNCGIAAHYGYAPFGAVIAQYGVSVVANPWRFSCEYAEDDTATAYYNYRHYEPVMGRWLSRDPIEEVNLRNLYLLLGNSIKMIDYLGLAGINGVGCKCFLDNVEKGDELFAGVRYDDVLYDEYSTYGQLKLAKGLAGLGYPRVHCVIDVDCDEKCSNGRAGYVDSDDKPHGGWFGLNKEFRIHVRLCMNKDGRTSGDFISTAKTLMHELIHASDRCRKQKKIKCGLPTVESINNADFDDKILTEIHAYSNEHRGVGGVALDGLQVIESAVRSIIDGCGILKTNANDVDQNFAAKLKERVSGLYEKGKDWTPEPEKGNENH